MYRAEVIGSMLRPSYLKESRAAFEQGQLPAHDFKRVEDRAVDQVIAMQEGTGVEVVTDGEMRRFLFMGPITETVEGIELVEHDSAMPWSSPEGDLEWTSPAAVTSKLRKVRSMVTEEYCLRAGPRAAAAEGHGAQPARPLRLLEPEALNGRVRRPVRDVRRRRRGRALGDPAARLARVRVHPGRRARARHARRPAHARLGRGPRVRRRAHADRGHRPDQRMVAGSPACAWGSTCAAATTRGCGWPAVATTTSPRRCSSARPRFDAYFLEYDDAALGSFEPLAPAPDDKQVVLGLVSTKKPALETPRSHRAHRRGRALRGPRPARALHAVRLRVDRGGQPDHRRRGAASCGSSRTRRTPPGGRAWTAGQGRCWTLVQVPGVVQVSFRNLVPPSRS